MPPTKSGAKLAISYGYIPCQLGLCGPNDRIKRDIITKYIKGDDSLEPRVKKILKEFKGAYPYYQLIAKSNKISNPLDYKVVEAYWIGNSLFEKIKVDDIKKMMRKKFLPLGKMPVEKIDNLSGNAIPFHNFHVLSIGSVTGTLKETRTALDTCRISWGKVKKVAKDKIIVSRQPLKFGRKVSLGRAVNKTVKWNKNILPEIKIDDWISIHWNHAIERLSSTKLKNIQKYTKKILEIIG